MRFTRFIFVDFPSLLWEVDDNSGRVKPKPMDAVARKKMHGYARPRKHAIMALLVELCKNQRVGNSRNKILEIARGYMLVFSLA